MQSADGQQVGYACIAKRGSHLRVEIGPPTEGQGFGYAGVARVERTTLHALQQPHPQCLALGAQAPVVAVCHDIVVAGGVEPTMYAVGPGVQQQAVAVGQGPSQAVGPQVQMYLSAAASSVDAFHIGQHFDASLARDWCLAQMYCHLALLRTSVVPV